MRQINNQYLNATDLVKLRLIPSLNGRVNPTCGSGISKCLK